MASNKKRLAKNAESKARAEQDGQPWGSEELELLALWDGTEKELADLAEILGRTIEACREKFYKSRRTGFTVTTTETRTHTTTTTYRGWTEADGDGWD